ncbi:MAG: LacI family DNA-binding transcriptional regulator [Verrucomicrobiota bacterium]
MPPNLQDIADAAGVGKSTVSLALRNDPRLREATRERIRKIAAEMGYQRNAAVSLAMAQIRSRGHSTYQGNLALLNVSHHKDGLSMTSTFREWVRGCHERGKKLGYGVDAFWLFEPGWDVRKLMGVLESRNIQGVLVAGILEHRRLPPEFVPLGDRYPSVALGVRAVEPQLHSCLNDQYATAMTAVREVQKLGYLNPGIVIGKHVDRLVDHRFAAGFEAMVRELYEIESPPRFTFEDDGRDAFLKWMGKAKPDVLLTLHDPVRDWLETAEGKVGEGVGLVHLDLSPDHEGWAGMLQNNDLVGCRALDIIIGQIHRNEAGVPERPSCVMVESSWRSGETVKRVG